MSHIVDIHTALPPQLVQSLTNPTTPIRTTAETFLSLEAVVGYEFPRGCQLKNTLDQIGGQQQYQQHQYAALTIDQGLGVIGSGKRTDGLPAGSAGGYMEYKVEYSEGQYTLKIDEDELCALLLNAEFVLVKMYSEYGIRRNPFLIRWIELYQQLLDDYLDDDDGDDGSSQYGRNRKNSTKNDGEVRLVKVRAAFIGAVLNEVEQISNYAPKEYAMDSTYHPVDISKFDDALLQQGVYESRSEIPWNQDRDSDIASLAPSAQSGIWGAEPYSSEMQLPSKQAIAQKDVWQTAHTPTPPPGLSTRRSYFPPPLQGKEPQPQPQQSQQTHTPAQLQRPVNYNGLTMQQQQQQQDRRESDFINKLITILLQAQVDVLPDANTSQLIKHFTEFPQHLLAVLDPSEPNLSALILVNPKLTQGLVKIYLIATGRSAERNELLNALERLPVELEVLELLNAICRGGVSSASGGQALLAKQEVDRLLHGFLSRAMLKIESLGSPASTRTPGPNSLMADIGYFSGANGGLNGMSTPGSRGGATPGQGGLAGLQVKAKQTRMVQLLCLFIVSLLNTGIIHEKEYQYEIEELRVRYIWVKEARELWHRVNTPKSEYSAQ
ncbi:hypothetical protein BGX38DRAFT_1265745 [Terfezia claveryi]|nr:hypothetical protein BGX38DRAFT_1265745 [Terfezia claveryi]